MKAVISVLDLEILKKNFGQIDFREKRPGLYKVLLPFFYEDGDMYDVFIEEAGDKIRISDHGLTLMKLSYTFDFDTEHKKEVLNALILQNRCRIDTGNIFLDVTPQQFTGGIYQFVQTVSKVSNMEIISKESVKSYFYELLGEFVKDTLKEYNVNVGIHPIKGSELAVDYEIPLDGKPLYLFGVGDDTKASKVVITCLTFQNKHVPFRSVIIHDDFEKLTRFNKTQIINISDKQFASLEDFKNEGIAYIQREKA